MDRRNDEKMEEDIKIDKEYEKDRRNYGWRRKGIKKEGKNEN